MGKAAREAKRTARKELEALGRRRRMSTNLKVTLGLLAAVVVALGVVVAVNRSDQPTTAVAAEALVRSDSHRLATAADGKVTLVEFLDFECEACGAAYPGVEKLRKEYGNRITYVVRYFPIASHPNAYNAAHAAEAAARQGKFEQMYNQLFDNQTQWGHSQQPQTEKMVGYATALGLDVAKFKADMASPEVAARVRSDAADGENAGVSGTPTFFLNGSRYEGQPTYEGLKQAIDEALER